MLPVVFVPGPEGQMLVPVELSHGNQNGPADLATRIEVLLPG
jgi:hypothetical protein